MSLDNKKNQENKKIHENYLISNELGKIIIVLNSSESTMILSQQLSSFLVERIHQRGSVGELIDGGVMRGGVV